MAANRRAITSMALALAVVACAAGKRIPVHRYRTGPQVRCDLPPRDYIYGNRPRMALALSNPVVLVRVPGMAPATPPPPGALVYAYYQLAQASVTVDHCSISRVVLTTWDTGAWSLDFRADQNPSGPLKPPLVLPGASSPAQFTAHIKRNLFTVRVRGLGASAAQGTPNLSIGRPVLFELAPEPFWVQRGVPVLQRFQGIDPQLARFLPQADRIEVELSYR